MNIHRKGELLTGADGIYASAVWDEDNSELIVKIVSNNEGPVPLDLKIDSKKKILEEALKIVLASDDLSAMNSISEPEHIAPLAEQIKVSRKTCHLELDPYSLTILKIQLD